MFTIISETCNREHRPRSTLLVGSGDSAWCSPLTRIWSRIVADQSEPAVRERAAGGFPKGTWKAPSRLAGGAPQLVGYGLSLALTTAPSGRGLARSALGKVAFSLYNLERHLPLCA